MPHLRLPKEGGATGKSGRARIVAHPGGTLTGPRLCRRRRRRWAGVRWKGGGEGEGFFFSWCAAPAPADDVAVCPPRPPGLLRPSWPLLRLASLSKPISHPPSAVPSRPAAATAPAARQCVTYARWDGTGPGGTPALAVPTTQSPATFSPINGPGAALELSLRET